MARLILPLENYPDQVRLGLKHDESLQPPFSPRLYEMAVFFMRPCCVFTDESLNFGVSTLEEIRLRKALKASMRRAHYPNQSAEASANGEKENIQSFFRQAHCIAGDGKNEEFRDCQIFIISHIN